MATEFQQRIDRIQAQHSNGQQALSRLMDQQARLDGELIRLRILGQVHAHGVARKNSGWYVNGAGRIVSRS